MVIRNLARIYFRYRARANAARARGMSIRDYVQAEFEFEELLGIVTPDAPVARLGMAVVSQAHSSGYRFVSFEKTPDGLDVWFHLKWPPATPLMDSQESHNAMRIQSNIAPQMLSHLVFNVSYGEEAKRKVLDFDLVGWNHTDTPLSKVANPPPVRGWLERPRDHVSLVLEILCESPVSSPVSETVASN